MAKESRRQKAVVGRVMHEFKQGELEAAQGGKVRSRRQAVAIALSEAGASDRHPSARNGRRLARTTRREDGETRQALYAQARAAGIPGRSRMTREELRHALQRH